jgi:L-lactate dehydrogenase
LRYQIGSHFNVSPKDVIAHILGEHGDSEFVWWSGASVAGIPLSLLPQYNRAFFDQMYQKTKNAAADIIACKGATYYAIALVTTKIIRAILLNQARVFSVSSFIENQYGLQDVCLSVPTIVRKSGICDRLNLPLNDEEQHLFAASAEKIKCTIAKAVTLL